MLWVQDNNFNRLRILLPAVIELYFYIWKKATPFMLKSVISFVLFISLAHLTKAQVTFVIEGLPPTQSKDTIFICGTFNNWVPNDKRYIVQKQLNGQLSITIPKGIGEMEYKFTRGDWMRVETSPDNKMIGNRKFRYGNGETVYVNIENWLDQGGARSLNYIVLYFFACAFQGIALCLLSFKIQKKDTDKFYAFIFINMVMIALLLVLVLEEFSNPIWQNYFSFIFDLGLLCWGPATLFFLHYFLKNEKRFYNRYLIGIPLAITILFAGIQIFNFEWFNFLSKLLLPSLTLANLLFIGAGVIYNFILFLGMRSQFPLLKLIPKTGLNKVEIFTNSFFWISFAIILFIPINIVVLNYVSHPFFEDFHVIGLAFTGLIFTETFFIWRNPELLREVKQPIQQEDTAEWFAKLDSLMKSKKPYRNPDLSVADLSDMLGTKPHVLSKVINENADKNFRDFLNKYRVEEFIHLVNTEEYKRYTFLALAQEVGFNSKSTFNLAFKKLTNQNPRDYFKSRETEE